MNRMAGKRQDRLKIFTEARSCTIRHIRALASDTWGPHIPRPEDLDQDRFES